MLDPMMEQLINSHVTVMKMRFGVYLFAATVLIGNDHNFISTAKAQTEPVNVDLSVIQDSAVSRYGSAYRTGLKIPPKSNPISQLYITPQNSNRQKVGTPKKNYRIIQPKNIKKLLKMSTSPAAPSLGKALTAPSPAPVPFKKVIKALAVPSTVSVPKPLTPKKNEKTNSSLTSTQATGKMVPSPPPLPPRLAKAVEPMAKKGQESVQPQSIKIAPGQIIQIEFKESATQLPEVMKDSLRKLVDTAQGKKELWFRLMAYANAEGMSASKARRLSLSRALSVRSFLIESGLRSTRIGVMALGNKSPDTPKNRVDISIAKR